MIKSRFSALGVARILILLLGMMFGMVLLIHHFEVPYGRVLTSLLASAKAHVGSGGSLSHVNSTIYIDVSENLMFSNALDANSSVSVNGEGAITTVLDEKDGVKENKHVGQNQSSDNITDVGSKSKDEHISHDIFENDSNSITKEGSDDKLASDEAIKRKDAAHELPHNETLRLVVPGIKNSSMNNVTIETGRSMMQPSIVVPLSEMNDMFFKSRASYRAMKPRWSSALDKELSRAKYLIDNTPPVGDEPSLYPTLFRNISMFRRSYELMEKTLKVYIYPEGERPIFHHAVLKGIYASEGWFMKLLKANERFVTKNPTQAHLFYLPFSSRMLQEVLYVPNSNKHDNLVQHLSDYLSVITSKYSFWNRTGGADHFLVACHDWAPEETQKIMANCIRALCNTDLVNAGFQFGKDISLPETLVRQAQNPLKLLGGKPPSERHILAFFAGRDHGYLRPILLKYWMNKDPDMQIFGKLPKKGEINYVQSMKSSKYCICAKGFEVNSPRVMESIFFECVPVIISDNFVPPLFETLNWESFALFILEKDVPNLKNILQSIPEKRYLAMQRRVKQVRRHFLWHTTPEKYDIFHMILHSIWQTRVFQISPM